MALSLAKGSFAAATSVGNQDVTIGFQAKAVIVWWTLQTAEGYSAANRHGMGMSDGSTHFCTGQADDDNVNPSNAGKAWNETNVIEMLSDGTPTIDALATVTFTATALRFNWSDAPNSAWVVHYFALGGSDVSAKTLIMTSKSANGSQSETGVGFAPKALLWLHSGQTSASTATGNGFLHGLAAGTGAAAQVGMMRNSFDNQATEQAESFYQDNSFVREAYSGVNPEYATTLTSFDADGWTANWTTTEGFGRKYGVLALGGGARYESGNDTQPLAPAVKDTAVSFTPTGVYLISNALTSNTLSTTQSRLSVGAYDGVTEGCTWAATESNVSPSDTNVSSLSSKALRFATGPSTTVAEADASVGVNKFSLNWTTADATARKFVYLAIGSQIQVIPTNVFPHIGGRGAA